MKERIKALRLSLGLNQTDFGSILGVKQATIAGYENGSRIPIDAIVSSICREFNVNEEWLRTGKGEMFRPKSRNEELAEFFLKAVEEGPSLKTALLTVMARLSEEQWEMLADVARKLAAEVDEEKNAQKEADQD